MRLLKKVICALLVMSMIISVVPMAAMAESVEAVAGRVVMDQSILAGQASVWIDGVEYAVQGSGDTVYVDLPADAEPGSMVVYNYHVGDAADVHTQYPLGMQVWALNENADGSFTPDRVEELDNILQYSGSSIRITGKKGIRMITSIERNKKNDLTAGGLGGYTLEEYGTVLTWSSNLDENNPLVLGRDYAKSNFAYKKDVADPIFAFAGNLMQYTNVLVDFTLDQCKDDIAMRPYMILSNEAGEQMTIYGGIVHRSIGYIAWQNRYEFAPSDPAYSYVWNIIRHVYAEVSYETNGGSAVESALVYKGGFLAQPADPVRDGYEFGGWYVDEALTEAFDFGTAVENNMVLYAKWDDAYEMDITIEQADAVVIDARQALNGTFMAGSAGLESIVCSVTNNDYPGKDHEIGSIMIDETLGTWALEGVRLYPGVNEITITIKSNDGHESAATVAITYDSGTLAEYTESQVEFVEEEGFGYVNDVILVLADAEASAEEREAAIQEVCESVNGTVVGQMNGAGMYQIRIEAQSYEELTAIAESVSYMEGIEASSCEYLIPEPDDDIESDDAENEAEMAAFAARAALVIPNDPWSDVIQGIFGQDWDESNPSGLNWWVEAVRAPSAWNYADRMNRIMIGIVDAGIDKGHEDLSITRSLNQNVPHNHGTHVAGIIGATANNGKGITGMAWNKSIINYDAYRGASYTSEISAGVNKLIEAGAKVINNSNGANLSSSSVAEQGRWAASLINQWADNITEDFIIVQAAGNNSVDSRRAGFCASVTDSRALEHIIIVAAAEKPSYNGSYKLTYFSNYGAGVTVAAPGSNVFSSIISGGYDGDYGKMSGTSMAAPIVTGVAAMVWSVNPSLTAGQVKQIIVDTATTPVSGYYDSRTYRMVDALAAVEEAIGITYDNGTASGYFVDATNAMGLGVEYRVHKDTEDGEIVYTGYSDAYNRGYFAFDVPAGDYVVEVVGTDFITCYVPVTIVARHNTDMGTIAISKEVDENTYRVVLRWGEYPNDLDSHLNTQTVYGEHLHIAYYNKWENEANLDVDDTSSYGPETITIEGTANLRGFKYSVHNYTNRHAYSGSSDAYNLSNSGAVVELYRANTLVATFAVPENRAGTVWNVFSVDQAGNLTVINSLEFESDPDLVGTDGVYVNASTTLSGSPAFDKDAVENEEVKEEAPAEEVVEETVAQDEETVNTEETAANDAVDLVEDVIETEPACLIPEEEELDITEIDTPEDTF